MPATLPPGAVSWWGLLPPALSDPGYLRSIGLGRDRCGTVHGVDLAVVVRAIPGTQRSDAALPWPYCQVAGSEDLDRVAEQCHDLVSVVGVVMTSSDEPDFPASAGSGPTVTSTSSTRAAPDASSAPDPLARGAGDGDALSWAVRDVSAEPDAAAQVEALYQHIVRRHRAEGSWLDFAGEHFVRLVGAPGVRTWAAVDADGTWGAFCCAAVDDDSLCMIHLGGTDSALRRDAMYALMPRTPDDERPHDVPGQRQARGDGPAAVQDPVGHRPQAGLDRGDGDGPGRVRAAAPGFGGVLPRLPAAVERRVPVRVRAARGRRARRRPPAPRRGGRPSAAPRWGSPARPRSTRPPGAAPPSVAGSSMTSTCGGAIHTTLARSAPRCPMTRRPSRRRTWQARECDPGSNTVAGRPASCRAAATSSVLVIARRSVP